ncbi:hypothetical protein [Streptomyces phaeofaciens]|uniref:hypothetical protein n=1 Tax=Streptomyces phaeofaciens TaxID=68254 RepID=UPI0036C4BFAB
MTKIGAGYRLSAVTMAGVVGAGLLVVGWPVVSFLASYGCGDREDRLAEVVAGEAVLGDGLKGATAEESYRECDDDDRFVVVGARYRYGGSVDSVLEHYGRAARDEGWAASGSGCFAKDLGGTTAYLTVEGPDDGRFHVEIVADAEGSPWC